MMKENCKSLSAHCLFLSYLPYLSVSEPFLESLLGVAGLMFADKMVQNGSLADKTDDGFLSMVAGLYNEAL